MSSLFSIRLKQLRKETGENQEVVAEYLGITRSNYSAYERDVAIPPYGKILMLANKFGVTVEYLMGQTNLRNYDLSKEGELPDIMVQLHILSDELMNKTQGVLLNGKIMTDAEKQKLVPMINSCIDMANLISRK